MNIVFKSSNTAEYLLIKSKSIVNTEAEMKEHCRMLFTEVLKYDTKKVLIDEPDTRFPTDMFIYYNLVTWYMANFPPQIRSLKIAVVIGEEFKEVGYFWETVCVNKGLQYFAFTNMQDAHNWLVQ